MISNCIGFLEAGASIDLIAQGLKISKEEVLEIAKENDIPIHE